MDIEKMWDIDHKAQLGLEISIEEKKYFNEYFNDLLESLKENYEHFKYHSGKFKI